jgi:two-component system chemotaxis response regulator CheY
MSLQNKTILVVAEFSMMRRLIIGCLIAELGCERIVAAVDGVEAVGKLQRGDIDFVISDWNMAQMGGLQLLRHVRGSEQLRHLPFLVIIAEAMANNMVDAVQAGADACLVKPVTAARLKEKLDPLVKRTGRV